MDELRSAFDGALRVLTGDLVDELERRAGQEHGQQWRERLQFDGVSLDDPSALLQLFQTDTPAARTLRVPKAVRAQIRVVRQLRHSHAHHEPCWSDVDVVATHVDKVSYVAACLNLPAASECRSLRDRLRDLAQGTAPQTQADLDVVVSTLEEQRDTAEAEARGAAEARRQLELAEAERDQLAEHVRRLEAERQKLVADRTEAERHRRELAHQAVAAEAGRAEAVAVAEAAAKHAVALERASARQLASLHGEIAAKEAEAERREAEWSAHEARERVLREQARSRANATAAASAHTRLDTARLQAVQAAVATTTPAQPARATRRSGADTLPSAGAPWPYPRGETILRLSARDKDLTTLDGQSLRQELGNEAATRAVTTFLKVRPTGGRVWVDEDGDCSTLLQGRLVYLGRLPGHAAAAPEMSPGTRLAELPDGRRYVLHKDDLTDVSTERRLSQVRGRQAAAAVAARLRIAKPAGGRIWVTPGGLAAARDAKDGHAFYLGHVRADEWFEMPGQPAHRAASATVSARA